MRALTKADSKRFWGYVKICGLDDCWEWIASLNSSGYGSFCVGERCYAASRIAYLLVHKKLKLKQEVCHKCDNPSCCNPAHLFAASHRVNMRDCLAKGRFIPPPPKLGEANPRSTLTEQQVLDIFHATGSQYRIAERFGVRQSQVSRIKLGVRWGHLTKKLA